MCENQHTALDKTRARGSSQLIKQTVDALHGPGAAQPVQLKTHRADLARPQDHRRGILVVCIYPGSNALIESQVIRRHQRYTSRQLYRCRIICCVPYAEHNVIPILSELARRGGGVGGRQAILRALKRCFSQPE